MPPLHASDAASFSEMLLLLSLTAQQQRPNLLVACGDTALEAVLTQLHALCAPPVHACVLPGPLTLPKKPGGTLLLHRVEALTIRSSPSRECRWRRWSSTASFWRGCFAG
jgi:hypothetical protein